MKKIEIFGRRVTIGIEKKEKKKKDVEVSVKEVVNEKIIYLIMILIITVLSANTYMLRSKLKIGDISTVDQIAPSDITYNDKEAKNEIISKILADSPKIYIEIKGVKDKTRNDIQNFFNYLRVNKIETTAKAYENLDETIDVSYKVFAYLFKQDIKDLIKLEYKYLNDVDTLYDYGIKKDGEIIRLNDAFDSIESLDIYEEAFLREFIKPNYILDKEKTQAMLENKISQLDDVTIHIKAGDLILKKGETVTEDKIELLKHSGLYGNTSKIIKFIGTIFYLFILAIIFRLICLKFLYKEIRTKSSYSAIIILLLLGMISLRLISPTLKYLLPLETVFILLGILVNIRTSLIIGGFIIMFATPLNGFNVEYIIIETFSLIVSLFLVTKIKNRTDIINAGVYLGILKVLTILSMAIVVKMDFIDSIIKSGLLFLSGTFTGMLTIALLPYFEKTFNILTDIKLLELGDLSQPLLRKLSVTAPGTFHHSMMVATLSEQATEAIGGNHVLARVASYYHDIGKMKRPQFYVENQSDGINPHNRLTPTMSTLIITSHTKDGDEMGREYNLPKEIRDIMYEHQGTTLLAYFYNKARQTNPKLEENNFRYSGPKPRSKESAVIMLADSIEAAVRSIDHKTPITIEKMLRKIINSKIESQQLSDADLTFKEIEIIIKSFTKVLMSIHHVRIKYPGQKS